VARRRRLLTQGFDDHLHTPTIKELVKEINEYLNPNIDKYESKDSKTYKINDVWIDNIKDYTP
jgi:hypothetical protein